jgi:RNA polymerase sigma-70 factor (ECF subfamily)
VVRFDAERMAEQDWKSAANAAMDRYARGDDPAFSELYELLAPRIYAFLARRMRDRAQSEDLVQQTFFQMHRARRHFCEGAAVLPWAIVIARRLLIDKLRQGKREVPVSDDALDVAEPRSPETPPDQALELRRLTRRVELELGLLPEASRVAFELIQLDGLSVAEAAEVLGTTGSAVKMRAHRAYEALRQKLGPSALEAL